MKILLIRHATRKYTTPEHKDPLSDVGIREAEQLATDLKSVGDEPTLLLTSRLRHATQTAEVLRRKLNPTAPILRLAALTPTPVSGLQKVEYFVCALLGRVRNPSQILQITSNLVQGQQYVQALLGEIASSPKAQSRLKCDAVIAIVTHYPRQVQIALQLQSQPPGTFRKRPEPAFAGALCLAACTVDDLRHGKAEEVVGLPYGRIRSP